MFGLYTMALRDVLDRVVQVIDGADRRLKHVDRDPRIASTFDIEMLVRAHGASEEQVRVVVDRMDGGRLSPPLVWVWTVEHDGMALAALFESRFDYELVEMFGRGDGRGASSRVL